MNWACWNICFSFSGFHYYTPIDYSGALPYALLEEEIADYLINDVKNGFSGTKVINFNNGIPSDEKRDEIKRDVLNKLTGSKGEKVIVAFNSNAESKTTVDDIPLNDAPAHYEYLSKECFEKLIVGHRVTSPMLFLGADVRHLLRVTFAARKREGIRYWR